MTQTLLPCKRADIVIIWWWDAVSGSAREQADTVKDLQLALNCNIGWIAHENDTRLVLCHGRSSTGEMDNFQIPVANIVKRLTICPKRKKK